MLSRKALNAIKFVFQITAQLLEGDKVCLLSQSHDGEKTLLKSLNGTPLSISEKRETKREISVSRSVLLAFNNNLIFCSGPGTGARGLHNQSICL